MRVIHFPTPMLPAQFVHQPTEAFRLALAEEGLDLRLPSGPVSFQDLSALAACSADLDGMETPVMLLFVKGRRAPYLIRASKVELGALEEGGTPADRLRRALVVLANQRPDLLTDQDTLELMHNQRHLRPVGNQLGQLASAFGRMLDGTTPPEHREEYSEAGTRVSPLLTVAQSASGSQVREVAPPPIVSARRRSEGDGEGTVSVPPVTDLHREDEPPRALSPLPPPVASSPSVASAPPLPPPVTASPSVASPPDEAPPLLGPFW